MEQPAALDELAEAVDASIADLTAIHDSDPAARVALRAVKLTTNTLRSFWLPTLDALRDGAGRPISE